MSSLALKHTSKNGNKHSKYDVHVAYASIRDFLNEGMLGKAETSIQRYDIKDLI